MQGFTEIWRRISRYAGWSGRRKLHPMRTHQPIHRWIEATAVGLMIAVSATASQAQSPGRGLAASASVSIRVVIPVIIRVKAFVQPAALEVSARDVAQGYVELDGASSLLLTSNSGRGCQLTVAFDASVVNAVEVDILNNRHAVRASQESLSIAAPRAIDAPVRIGYRLFLNRQVVPGVYAWPVNLAFSAAAA